MALSMVDFRRVNEIIQAYQDNDPEKVQRLYSASSPKVQQAYDSYIESLDTPDVEPNEEE